MVAIAEEEVRGLDVLMQDVVIMTVGEGSGSLQGYAAELVHVSVNVVVAQRSSGQILHELVVAVLAVDIGLSEIIELDYHLEAEGADDLQHLLVDVEVGVVHLQHERLLLVLDKENLCFAGIVAQAFQLTVLYPLQHKDSALVSGDAFFLLGSQCLRQVRLVFALDDTYRPKCLVCYRFICHG